MNYFSWIFRYEFSVERKVFLSGINGDENQSTEIQNKTIFKLYLLFDLTRSIFLLRHFYLKIS